MKYLVRLMKNYARCTPEIKLRISMSKAIFNQQIVLKFKEEPA
jgi:hypothetical protein